MMDKKVYNWQLKRKMKYKYPEAPPKKQVTWVFDTNKCIACQTCTFACKNAWTSGKGQESMWWNNVETKPWGFYPLGWDINLLQRMNDQVWKGDKYVGDTIYEGASYGEEIKGNLPEDEDYKYPNLGEDEVNQIVKQGDYITVPHKTWMFYLQRICNHCSHPACLAACPRKAIYKREEDGIVLIDQKRCRGYRECVKACPYKKSFYRAFTGKSEKCIACYPTTEKGLQTQCVQNCIGKIRIFGFSSGQENARDDNPIDYLVHKTKIALPLYPQFGTAPNVYYIPPIHVPEEFNKQMFGPGAKEAVARYRKAPEDLKLIGLLMLFTSTDKIVDSFKVEGDIKKGRCIGYNAKGEEVVQVPLKEPIIIREAFDKKRDVTRISVS